MAISSLLGNFRRLSLTRVSTAKKALTRISADSLPDEVLTLICHWSRKRVPARGAIDRGEAPALVDYHELAQPELAALMRVSKRFNAIAGPILYETIITDNLLLLVHGALKGPSGFQTHSQQKLSLLAHCHHLYLEPSRALMYREQGGNPKLAHKERKRVLKEVELQAKAFTAIIASGGFDLLVPNLVTLSLSAYTDQEQPIENRYIWHDERSSCQDLYKAWLALLATSNAAHRCSTSKRFYPFHGDLFQPSNERGWVQRRTPDGTAQDPVHYIHVPSGQVPDRSSHRFNQKTVLLWSAPLSARTQAEAEDDVAIILDVAAEIRKNALYLQGVQVDVPEDRNVWLDYEVRIFRTKPQSPVREGEKGKQAVEEEEDDWDLDYWMGIATRKLDQLYVYPGRPYVKRTRDVWTIRVEEGDLVCPACEPNVGTRGESSGKSGGGGRSVTRSWRWIDPRTSYGATIGLGGWGAVLEEPPGGPSG